HILIGLITGFFAAGVFSVGSVTTESATLAEEQTAAARAQAAIAQENADRAALAAVIAEKQAVWADQESPAVRRARLEYELAVLKAHETAHGLVLTLGDVLFAPNQSELTPAALRKLSPLTIILKEQLRRRIRIEGYTDNKGSESYNLDLSQ